MSTKIQLRRDTAANWAATNPVLSQGEAGYDITNNILKIGNGTASWNTLPGIIGGGGGAQVVLNSIDQDGHIRNGISESSFIFHPDGTITFPNGTNQTGAAISLADLKTLVAASTDFADFQTRIAAL